MKLKLALLMTLALAGQAAVIDFEGLPSGTSVSNEFPGLTFNNATVLSTADLPAEFPPHSGVNAAFDNGAPIVINFLVPATFFSGFFTYSVPLTITAFDASNNVVASATSTFSNNAVGSGNPANENIVLSSLVGFSSISLAGNPGGRSFIVDDINAGNSVPEPGTVGLLLAGLGSLIAIKSKRR